MSLRAEIIELVRERGSATVDELMPHMEEWTREQVLRAMQRAKFERVFECDRNVGGRVGGSRKGGSKPARYRLHPRIQPPPPKVVPKPLASVWELASEPESVAVWPPVFHGGRPYQLLWDEA